MRSSAARKGIVCLVLSTSLAACAGGSSPPPRTEESPLESTRGAKVYDAQGKTRACEAPPAACPEVKRDADLSDRCSLSGYRLVQCGCEMLCTGDTSKAGQHWDSEGNAKACEPAKPDCEAPPASAAFQDACNEKGYKLEVCGCAWLCSGNPTK